MTTPRDPAHAGVFWASLSLAAAVVASTLAVAAVREVAIGQRELAAAEEASKVNDWPRAILHAKGAAQAMAPLSPWPEQGARRLQAIAHDAETRGDATTALRAYGALRAAAISTDAPGTSVEWRKDAEAGLVRVAAWERSGETERAATKPNGSGDGASASAPAAMRDALARGVTTPSWPVAALCVSALAILGASLWMAFVRAGVREMRIAQSVLALAVLASGAVLLAN